MSWLRLDDKFDTHSKVLALGTDDRRWTWNRVLLYTVRHNSAKVPANVKESIPKATKRFLSDCAQLGLLEESDGQFIVHDWPIYNGATVSEKVSYYLSRHPDATANEVVRGIGGMRELVLAEVKRYRDGTNSGSTEPVRENQETGTESGSRARGPVLDLDLPAFVQEAEPLPSPLEALPLSQTLEERNPHDPVVALLNVCSDTDEGSERVLRSLRLPEYAYRQATEQISQQGGGIKLAVAILKRIEHEYHHPPDTTPVRTNVEAKDPETRIRTMLENGSLTDPVALEAELRAAGLNGDLADQLRAQLATNPPDPEDQARLTALAATEPTHHWEDE